MSDEIAPEWLELTTLGSRFEEQLDKNASSSSPWLWRHRTRRPTGQPEAEWKPGRAPQS